MFENLKVNFRLCARTPKKLNILNLSSNVYFTILYPSPSKNLNLYIKLGNI